MLLTADRKPGIYKVEMPVHHRESVAAPKRPPQTQVVTNTAAVSEAAEASS